MTQKNSNSDDVNNPPVGGQPPTETSAAGAAPAPKPKKKKRRLILKTLAVLVVLLILGVLLAPTIISTGMVREMVLGQINSSVINGKLAIKDWSFGWTSGVRIEGVELTDTDNKHLLSASEISTPISFLKAATGNIDLGDVVVSGVDFNAIIDAQGQLNFLKAIKPSNKPPSNEPAKLPNIRGVIHLKQITGTFEDDPAKVTAGLDPKNPLNATITITGINQPIEESVDLGLQVADKTIMLVKVNGTLSAIQNNLVAIDHVAANQTIEISEGDLAPLSKVLRAMHLNLDVTGKMNGKITATVNTLENITADAGITVAGLSAGGEMMAGDTVAYQSVQINLKAAVASSGGKGPALTLDMPITAQPTSAGAPPDKFGVFVDAPQDGLVATGAVFQAIAADLGNHKNPATTQPIAIAGSGQVKITAEVGVANLVSQVPHLMHLEQGTSLTSGRFTHETTITLANNEAVIATQTHLKDFAGTNSGTPVRLTDIDTMAGITAVGGDKPGLQKINLNLTSAFASVQGGGDNLGKISFQGTSDLANLQKQVGQIIDLDSLLHATAGSHVTLAGTLAFHAHVDGDLMASDSAIGIGADFSASNINLNIPGHRSIDEPKLTASIAGDLHHTEAQFVQAVHNIAIAIQSPAINFQADGEVKVGGKFGVSVPIFSISQGTIDLRLLQEEFGGALSLFIPKPSAGQPANLLQRVADNSVRIASGNMTISGKGQFNQSGFGFPQPLNIQIQPTDLTVADEMGTVQTVHVPVISVVVAGNGTVSDQVATVKNLTVTQTMGTADSPLFEAELAIDATVPIAAPDAATGTAKLDTGASMNVPRIELVKCEGDLPKLQSTFGVLFPLIIPAPAAGSAAATQPSIMQMVMENYIVCTSGKLTASMMASYDGTTLTLGKPLTVSIADLTLQQEGGGASSTPISDETLTAAFGGSVSMSGGHINASLHKLNFSLGDELKIQGSPEAPLDMALNPAGEVSASGSVQLVHADFPKILHMASMILTPEQMASANQLTSGQGNGWIRITRTADGTTASADVTVNSLTVGKVLNNETVHLIASASLASDMSAVRDATANIETSFAKKISITNGQVLLQTKQDGKLVPVGLFDKVQSLDAEVDELDLAKVDALLNLLKPAAATVGPAAPGQAVGAADKVVVVVAVAPLPQITSGIATLKASISRRGDTTTANVSQVLVHSLAVKTGNQSFAWPSDITAQLSADVQTIEDPTGQMPIMDQLARVSVTALSADLGITKIGLSGQKPILVTGLSDPASLGVEGGVTVDGDIEPAARLAEVFMAAPANAYPYKGHYHFDEAVAKDASQSRLHILGGGAVTQFVVMGPAPTPAAGGGQAAAPAAAPVAFSEDKIAIQNGFDFDFKTFSVIIDRANPISVSLESTGALAVQVKGSVHDLLLKREIPDDDHVSIEVTYDLAKLWTIVKPLLSPSQQQTFADLTISGHQTRTLSISGSYPADKPFGQAISMITVGGYYTVDSLSTQGITIQNLDFPLCLKGGVFRTVYPDLPEGQNAPKPAKCNDGSLDIGVIVCDLRTDPMTVSMPGADSTNPHFLLKNISMNAALAKTMFGKVLNNPAFANASSSRGLASVSVLQLQDVPMSALVLQASPQNQGIAHVQYSIHELQLGSELLAAFGNSSVSADINNADVVVQNGKVTEDTTMMIDQNKPLRIAGVVILATKQFAPMTAYIPTALLGNMIPGNVRQYVPDQVTVPMKGDMNHPKLELDKVAGQLAKDAAKKALLNGLLGGNQNNGQQGTDQGQQQQPQKQDPLGSLLNGLGKKHH